MKNLRNQTADPVVLNSNATPISGQEKPVRAIFLECSLPFFVDVAARLEKEHGWKIVLWVSGKKIAARVKSCFPSAFYYSSLSARLGAHPPEGLEISAPPLKKELLDDFTGEASLVMKMMDRLDLEDSFGAGERTALFHHQLTYWRGVLEFLKPDIVVFPTSPHVVYDYLVYAWCKRLGIQTVMFERAGLPSFLLSTEQFEQPFSGLLDAYQTLLRENGDTDPVLSAEVEDFLVKSLGEYHQAMPVHLHHKLKHKVPPKRDWKWVARKFAAPRRYQKYLFIILRNLLGNPDLPIGRWRGRNVIESGMTGREVRGYLRWKRQKRTRLQALYDELARPPDFDAPYVYVALHCQPERSTSPNGGVFADQVLMVEVISKSLPPGWQVFVKEHVSQYKPYQAAEQSRNEAFYRTMAAFPGVRLVPMDTDTFQMTDHARAVATVTGTVGLEAILRSVPVMVFGYAWYRGCEGVFSISTETDCRLALKRIADGFQMNPRNIRLFLKALEDTALRGFIDPIYQERSGISLDENVDTLVNALRNTVENTNRPASDSTAQSHRS